MAVIDKVKNTIKKYSLLKSEECVCVAVSGGVDSSVLLHLLHGLSGELGIRLVVCHLNHKLRGEESERDYRFVEETARELGICFEGARVSGGDLERGPGESVQQWARAKRLEFLEQSAKKHGAGRIATGHNLDDQAETVLMRVLSGSSLKGLCGIAPSRGLYIRPLIEVSKDEIEEYARKCGVGHVSDSSNKSNKYERNRLRQRLIPLIEGEFNPRFNLSLARAAETLSIDSDFIEGNTDKAYERVVSSAHATEVVMDRRRLLGLHKALRARMLLRAVTVLRGKAEPSGLYFNHIEGFLSIVRGRRPNAILSLPGELYLSRCYDEIRLTSVLPKVSPYREELKVPGLTVIEEAGVRIKATLLTKRPTSLNGGRMVAYFDHEKLTAPSVRSFKPGDRIVPLGMNGTRKLKDIFIDEKVPALERQWLPLLVSGDEVVWAVGLKFGERCKVEPNTKSILRVECSRLPYS